MTRSEKGVDAGCVSLEPAPDACRQKWDLALGGTIKAENPHLAVSRHCLGPESLCEPPGAVAALQLHLEQPVLGMCEAKAKGCVFVVLRGDQWDAVSVALDTDFGFRPGHGKPAIGLRQRRPQIEVQPTAYDEQQRRPAND